jgi:hypothetical protein
MYPWFVFLHLVGLVLFLLMHGVSLWVAFRIRRETDPAFISTLLGLSSRGNQGMYVGLLLLGVGGLAAAATMGWLLTPWAIASYVVLAAVLVGMWAVGAGFYYPLREALAAKDGGAPLAGDELWRLTTGGRSCWPRIGAAGRSYHPADGVPPA